MRYSRWIRPWVLAGLASGRQQTADSFVRELVLAFGHLLSQTVSRSCLPCLRDSTATRGSHWRCNAQKEPAGNCGCAAWLAGASCAQPIVELDLPNWGRVRVKI